MGMISGCLFLFLQTIFADSGHTFPFLAEILRHTMPKFTISGGDSFTWLGQGMYIMLGCLFLFSGQFLLIYGAFFLFWKRFQGAPGSNPLSVLYTFLLGLDKVWATYLGVSFSFSIQFLLIQGTLFHFLQSFPTRRSSDLLYLVETALLGLDKVCTSCLDVSSFSLGNFC